MLNYLSDIISYIKTTHTWFAEVSGPAWVNDFDGRLLYGTGPEYQETGIDDRMGSSHAYIRTTGVISYGRPNTQPMAGCIGQTQKSLPGTLVAVLYEADPNKLETTLINTLLSWGKEGAYVNLINSQVITNISVLDEYTVAGKEVQEEALQRIGKYVVVSINFNVTVNQVVFNSKCPCNPCTSC